ncbi:thioredoxin-disulfide reductase [Candidatus Babeliales bacterium]|nr:thioredoxin-disulfide reductase [Candidatus Babeliales bacterium]
MPKKGKKMVHKLIILGSGPAGLTAGIYAARGKLSPLIIEGNKPGGQLTTTTYVENWPGEKKILGIELMEKIKKHAEHYGTTFLSDSVIKADLSKKPYTLTTEGGKTLSAESIIIATGASHKKLKAKGEDEYWGKGVTTCATCDAPFYQDKEVVIAGGGNTAVTEAAFLTRFAKKITIIQILDKLSANDPIRDEVEKDPKIEIILNSAIKEIKGDGKKINVVVIENQKTKESKTIPTSGVFVAIGFKPNTDIFKDQLDMDEFGYLKIIDHTKTSKEGIFTAGDVSDYKYMQAVTSSGFGCMAALDCETYLQKQKKS